MNRRTDAAGGKILVVDDEPAIVAALVRALESAGFECTSSMHGVDALVAAQNTRFDMVVTDLRMPVMHGHALIGKLIEMESPPLIVVVTAVVDTRIEMDLYDKGVVEVAYKPVNYDRLVAKIRTLLRFRAEGGGGGAPGESLAVRTAREIADVRTGLEQQLEVIQTNFKSTIERLTKQEAELEENYLGSVRVLANLIESGNVSEGSHSARVESMASKIAERAGIDGLQHRGLKVAALLHEIGQFGLPDKIRIVPPWELGGSAKTAYQSYPTIGATLLSQVPGSSDVAEWVEYHAENFDGSGFPDGKAGRDIPLCSRILGVADGLDTFLMFSRDTRPKQEISKEHLLENSGYLYDPDLANKAIAIIDNLLPETKKSKIIEIPAKEIVPGHVLAKDVFDRSGICLVRKGMTVTDALAVRLHRSLLSKPVLIYSEGS